MASTTTSSNIHVVMIPWSAFGHMIPFLQLSTALAEKGVKVSFISTPRNIQRLPKIPSNLSLLLNLIEIPLPKLENKSLLPENAEATIDIPSDDGIQYLKVAYDLLKHPIRDFVSDHSPDFIIVDFSPYWMADIAREFKIPLLFFTVFNAASSVFFGVPKDSIGGDGLETVGRPPESMASQPEWVDFPSSVAYQKSEAAGNHAGFNGMNASGISDAHRIATIKHASSALLIRSCYEFESEYLNVLQKINKKPVIPVGLLPPEKPKKSIIEDGFPWGEVFKWLDQQVSKSVIFVGFGSECKLKKEQVHEIAYGLELSKLPFLWALRKPNWAIDNLDALPVGFCHRTSDIGIVSFGWAPQMEILGHPSIGGSLFHSGWGSIIETLQFGHVLVVLPFIIDQGLNAKLLVDKGLAIEVERSDEDGSFTRDGISRSLRMAMVEMEGEKFRVRAKEASKIFGDQKLHQDKYIGGFVGYLRNGV